MSNIKGGCEKNSRLHFINKRAKRHVSQTDTVFPAEQHFRTGFINARSFSTEEPKSVLKGWPDQGVPTG